jgi:hypothetical protein
VKPKEVPQTGRAKPLLMVDIDGVVSLFGFAGHPPADGSFHQIDGIPHFLSSSAAAHLLALSRIFELVWASGWEEKANEHLPRLLGLPAALPFLRFTRSPSSTQAHWKLESIDAYAAQRPLAWIDDSFNPACHAWAEARPAPTLLVSTAPEHGLTAREARLLAGWAGELQAG